MVVFIDTSEQKGVIERRLVMIDIGRGGATRLAFTPPLLYVLEDAPPASSSCGSRPQDAAGFKLKGGSEAQGGKT